MDREADIEGAKRRVENEMNLSTHMDDQLTRDLIVLMRELGRVTARLSAADNVGWALKIKFDALRAENDKLREALQAMVDHEVACMTLYNLGDPEKQSYVIRARAALRYAAPPASGEAQCLYCLEAKGQIEHLDLLNNKLRGEMSMLREALLWVKPRIVERYLTKGEAREMLGKIDAALAAEPASGVEHDNERIDPLGGNSPPPMGAVVSNADVLATMDALYKFNVATEEEANRNLIPPPPQTQDPAMTEPSQSSREIAEEIRQSAQDFGFRQWAEESDFAIHLAECLDVSYNMGRAYERGAAISDTTPPPPPTQTTASHQWIAGEWAPNPNWTPPTQGEEDEALVTKVADHVSDEIVRQYRDNPTWEDAKDMAENLDAGAITRLVIAALRQRADEATRAENEACAELVEERVRTLRGIRAALMGAPAAIRARIAP